MSSPSLHVWASNHWLEADRFTATKSGQICFSFFSLVVLCVFCSSTHSKWRPAPGKDEGRVFLLATSSQGAISTINSNTTSMVHKHLGLWAVFMFLLGSKSSSCGGITQHLQCWPSLGSLRFCMTCYDRWLTGLPTSEGWGVRCSVAAASSSCHCCLFPLIALLVWSAERVGSRLNSVAALFPLNL